MKATAKLETSLAYEKLQKMSLIMLAEYYFTHKINHHVILPSFQIDVRK